MSQHKRYTSSPPSFLPGRRQRLKEMLAQTIRYHQAGHLYQAETLYRQVLDQDPHQADALHPLGVLASQTGGYEMAIALIKEAISRNQTLHTRTTIRQTLEQHITVGKTIAIWGGTGRAAALINSLGLDADHFPQVVDSEWRAQDIVLEIRRHHIPYQQILLEYQGRLVDYFADEHPSKSQTQLIEL